MMKIKRHINRFRAWQRKPIQFSDQGLEEHCCANCGHTYSGNYCPVCGQKAGDKRITWRLVGQNFLKAWGIDSRSLPNTLLQLILRPGYLIGDYLDGRRRVSYPPVNMLFVVAVFYLIITRMFGITRMEHYSYSDLPAKYAFLADIINWMIDNPEWGMMFVTLMFVIPTWFFFRYVLVLFIVYYYFTYRQLFGYRFWGTLWHLLLSMVVAFWGVVLSMSIVINIGSSTFNVTGIFRELAIIVILLSAGYLICRRTAKNRYAIDDK